VAHLGYARVDTQRSHRQGMPECVFCPGKTPTQVAEIMAVLFEREGLAIGTRASRRTYQAVKKRLPQARYHTKARVVAAGQPKSTLDSLVLVASAGTVDIPVAEEAAVTAELLGLKVERLYDVGVAGLHRLLAEEESLHRADVIVVVAGMEGALASVVGGLVDCPVIAVPTSNGYGASMKGLSALLTMLTSCVPGVAVVNIDNGFGAAALAHRIARVGLPPHRGGGRDGRRPG
jgi:NCAIR mutase (PurE)-related protein